MPEKIKNAGSMTEATTIASEIFQEQKPAPQWLLLSETGLSQSPI